MWSDGLLPLPTESVSGSTLQYVHSLVASEDVSRVKALVYWLYCLGGNTVPVLKGPWSKKLNQADREVWSLGGQLSCYV